MRETTAGYRAVRLLWIVPAMIALIGSTTRADIIDRILAVVDAEVITQSDVTGAVRLGLVTVPVTPGQPLLAAALERMIDRQVTLDEMHRYAPPDPAPADIDRKLQEIRARFPSAAEFDKALAETGLSPEQLRREASENLRVEAYLLQRFGSAFQPPSEAEILDYYRTHQAELSRGGTVRPFADAHDEIRATLVATRRAAQIKDWVAGLRRRANVSVLLASK